MTLRLWRLQATRTAPSTSGVHRQCLAQQSRFPFAERFTYCGWPEVLSVQAYDELRQDTNNSVLIPERAQDANSVSTQPQISPCHAFSDLFQDDSFCSLLWVTVCRFCGSFSSIIGSSRDSRRAMPRYIWAVFTALIS